MEMKKRRDIQENACRYRQQGSILIYLIAVLVVAGALGAGIISLTTTSTFTELTYNSSDRSRYLAMSGINYAQWAWGLKDVMDPLDLSGWDWKDQEVAPETRTIILNENQESEKIILTFTSDGSSVKVESVGTVLAATSRESHYILGKVLNAQ
ncbi:hypothetical protein [Desulfonatronovibrio hydrogenovorans]|uniref:hypothetical protein n=1 Tax=Desulfonatronovibrio hydrogenovorans TaxID=53245 RepID=UPI0004903F13|nr:hypothetical protein [Desulfonatronovibrio hydrogenovorans]